MMDKYDKAFYKIIIAFSIIFIMFSLLLFRFVFIMGEEIIKRELKNEQEQSLGVINGK